MYYIINTDTNELVRTSETPFNIDDSVQPPAPFKQLKRVVDDTQPAYNSATQKLVRTFVDDDAQFTRTFIWSAVNLTQAELDAKADATNRETLRQQIKPLLIKLKNGTATAAEVRQVVLFLAWEVLK